MRVKLEADVPVSSMFTLLVDTGGLTLCAGGCLLGSLAVRRTWMCKLLVGSAVSFLLLSFSGVVVEVWVGVGAYVPNRLCV